jgi:hypothetical protein
MGTYSEAALISLASKRSYEVWYPAFGRMMTI